MYRDFRWMLIGSFVSFLAMNMQMMTRGWLILRLTNDSPTALTWVMVSFALPMATVSPLVGALADRLPRKYLIIVSQTGNVLLTAAIGLLDFTGVVQFWHLMVIGFINGSLMAFNMPSRQAILSEIVPEDKLMNAISLNNSGMNLTRIIGPAVAGFLILFIDTAGVFFVVSAIYVFSVVSAMMIDAGKKPATSSRKNLFGDMVDGMKYARADTGRFGLMILLLITSLFGFSYFPLMPAWAREALNVQSDGLGILMTIMGVGALVGTLGLASMRNVGRKGMILIASSVLWGIALAAFSQVGSFQVAVPIGPLGSLFGLASDTLSVNNYLVAIPFLVTLGAISAISMSMSMTMMQTLAEPHMRGRMMSIGMMTFGIMPLTALPFGYLAEWRGSTPDALLISGVILAVVTLAFGIVNSGFRRVN